MFSAMNGILLGAGSGGINGTTRGGGHCDPNDPNACGNNAFRVGNGTGVYGLGSQRQIVQLRQPILIASGRTVDKEKTLEWKSSTTL